MEIYYKCVKHLGLSGLEQAKEQTQSVLLSLLVRLLISGRIGKGSALLLPAGKNENTVGLCKQE